MNVIRDNQIIVIVGQTGSGIFIFLLFCFVCFGIINLSFEPK